MVLNKRTYRLKLNFMFREPEYTSLQATNSLNAIMQAGLEAVMEEDDMITSIEIIYIQPIAPQTHHIASLISETHHMLYQ